MRFIQNSLLVLVLTLTLCYPSMASDPMDPVMFPVNLDQEQNGTRMNSFLSDIMTLLPLIGVDTKYKEGTIFDMVGISLFSVIDMLASGETEGFFTIPLINETLSYSNISPDEIIISPDEIDVQMPAISHFQTYQGISSYIQS